MKCKNIECNNEAIGKRVYCSLSCRNIFVNKYLRNYNKYSDTCLKKKSEREIEYLKNPKKCLFCDEIIPFNKNGNDYCNRSCMASKVNKKRKGIKHNLSEKGRKVLVESAWKNLLSEESRKKSFESQNKKYNRKSLEDQPKLQCVNCGKLHRNKKYCSSECRRSYKRKNMDEYPKYKQDCLFKFNLSDYPEYFDFSLIEKYGWYSPTNKNNNLDGVSRDHMLSVREGFELGIDPKIISHPANCRLMIHRENISKNKNSILTIESLLERIKKFEEKYMNKRDA